MKANPTITVGIVEDNAALAASLRKIVESSPALQCVGVWRTGEEALAKAADVRPEVILMDINLPGISGIETTARVKVILPEVNILMVTVYADHDKIFQALKAGACGYLLKATSPPEVLVAIKDIVAGNAPMSPEIARRVVESFHPSVTVAHAAEAGDLDLSPRQMEVLKLIADGLSNKEIAAELELSFQTVQVHVRNIFEKLHVRSRTEAAMRYRDGKG